MPEICENWLGLVNSCVYYVRYIRGIGYCLTQWGLKLPGRFEYLVNLVLFGMEDL